MVQYVDYVYYKEKFKGTIPEDAFEHSVVQASAFVRKITFNNISEENVLDEVKDAVCAVCDVIYQDKTLLNRTKGREVRSENVDGYSVSYVSEGRAGKIHEETLSRKMYFAAQTYLLHTGLLYCGV